MGRHVTQQPTIRLELMADANAAVEVWHERLVRELGMLQGIELIGVDLGGSSAVPASGNPLMAVAYGLDNMMMQRRPRRRRGLWADIDPHLFSPRTAEDASIVIDLRSAPAEDAYTTSHARQVWSLDFLRVGPSPEDFSVRAATAGKGSFSVALERATAGGFVRIDHAVCAARASAARNLEQARQAAIAMILRTLRSRIAGSTAPEIIGTDDSGVLSRENQLPDHQAVSALRFAGGLCAFAAARATTSVVTKLSAWRGAVEPKFRLYRSQGSPLSFSLSDAKPLRISQHQYFADPFLLRHSGRLWAFCEVFEHSDNIGRIGVAELTEEGLGEFQIVLPGGPHRSYPFVFEHSGEIFMIPESCATLRLEVWRAVRFPGEWELVATALEGTVAVDSSLHHDGERWWLFTNAVSDAASDPGLELCVFETDGPHLRRLAAHAGNPVVIDTRYSRNAGRVFSRNGRIYRPAQSHEFGLYGYGLSLMEVLRLGQDGYAERPVRFIHGCHHLDICGEDIIFDLRGGVSLEQAATSAQNG